MEKIARRAIIEFKKKVGIPFNKLCGSKRTSSEILDSNDGVY
jgi:hypothetical protein